MASLYGIMGLADVANLRVDEVGQRIVFDAVRELVARYNTELGLMTRTFVQGDTIDPEITYALPGGGMMQESTEYSRPGAIRPGPSYSVGFEIRDARDQIAWDDISLAYATVEQVENLVNNAMIRHTNWVRFHMLRALFHNAARTFKDPMFGDVVVQPLANGDATLYPPTIGGTDNTTRTNYVASNMAGIADITNPIPTYEALLDDYMSGGDVVLFAHPTQANQIRALTSFIDLVDPMIRVYQGQEAVWNGPAVPGEIIGRVGDVWISEWRWMPAGYVYLQNLMYPAPLMRRLDRVNVAGRGQLALIAQQQEMPFIESFWRDRHGFGVANRLNGVVGQITGAAYTIPALYA